MGPQAGPQKLGLPGGNSSRWEGNPELPWVGLMNSLPSQIGAKNLPTL